jgi:hypothetical protein
MSFPPSLSPTTEPPRKPSWIEKILPVGLPDDTNHPVQIALRTYAVSLSLSLGPSLLPFIIALFRRGKQTKGRARSLEHVLKRELGPNGFAFAITVAVGGGAALQRLWEILEESGQDSDDDDSLSEQFYFSAAHPGSNALERKVVYRMIRIFRRWNASAPRKAFACNLISSTIAVILLQRNGGRNRSSTPTKSVNIPLTMPIDVNATKQGPSPTLDLTLLLLVRAVDATIQSTVFKESEKYLSKVHTIDILGSDGEVLVSQTVTAEAQRKDQETKWRQKMTTRLDAFIFWACSARSVIDMQVLKLYLCCTFG